MLTNAGADALLYLLYCCAGRTLLPTLLQVRTRDVGGGVDGGDDVWVPMRGTDAGAKLIHCKLIY